MIYLLTLKFRVKFQYANQIDVEIANLKSLHLDQFSLFEMIGFASINSDKSRSSLFVDDKFRFERSEM